MKNLVIIAAGKTSEHQKWSQNHLDHGFDLCILNYSEGFTFNDKNTLSARYLSTKAGMKFKLIAEFYENNPDAINDYEYVFMMDDDIETNPSEIQKFFEVCEQDQFDLAQPGLSLTSTYTYLPTRKIKGAKYHLTNMVEIMMPCFSKRLLKETLVDIKAAKNGIGWGLEGVWNKKFHTSNGTSKFGGKIGVIDCVEFGHYRSLGGTESKIYEKFGSPWEALAEQEARVGFKWSNMPFITESIKWNNL
jgi:hypothetical protein